MSEVLITTGYNFEGYHIVKYLGIVSANLMMKNYSNSMWQSKMDEDLGKMQNDVIKKLTSKTISVSGNGIIGLQFYQFDLVGGRCFSGSATAVLLAKEKN